MLDKLIVNVEKLVYGGNGLARLEDGRTVFIPFTLPGEKAEIEVVEDKGKYLLARVINILSASPDRIQPLCPHFGVCGGCHYQHLGYAQQTEVKLSILQDQLERIGHISRPPISGISGASTPWNYRNQIQFHPKDQGKLGFMDITGRQIMEVKECHLPTNGIGALWPQLDLEPESGLDRISFREDSFSEVMLLMEGQEEYAPEMEIELPISVAYRNPGGELFTLAGHDSLTFSILGKELSVSTESFFQVNTEVASRMLEFVLDRLPQKSDLNTLELYSGVGFFSTFLAERSKNLTAIESSSSACYDFANNLDAFDNVSLYEGAVEQILPGLVGQISQPDLVLLDPPRAGLHTRAREALLKIAPKQMVYISCDPSTLARDLHFFIDQGYMLDEVHAFDMFPQTYHVETIVVIQRAQRVTT